MVRVHIPRLLHSVPVMAAWLILSALGATAGMPADTVWSGTFAPDEAGRLRVRFVRGRAEIRRRPGPVVIIVHKQSKSGKADRVSIRVTASDEGIEITDIYPRSWMAMWPECLPKDTGRGDFWNSDVRLRTIVLAPEEVAIDIHFMDGGEIIEK